MPNIETAQTAGNGQPAGQEPIPAISSARALQSLRDSGFDLPTALAELIDNSIDASANEIEIFLEEEENDDGPNRVSRIAVADDGMGMDFGTLMGYLVLGFRGDRSRDDTIGKYGVGAKLAAINFAQRIDAWSRTSEEQPWRHSQLHLDKYFDQLESHGEADEVKVHPPDQKPVPGKFDDMLSEGTSGTLVVWSKIDRLEEGQQAANFVELRSEVVRELSRMFRKYLDGGIQITVNGRELMPYDPLFLMEGHWGDRVLNQWYDEAEEGEHHPATSFYNDTIEVAGSEARVRVTLYPKEVLRKRFMGDDELAHRLNIPGTEGYISFVRFDREIAFTKPPQIFPSAVTEGDRFIGIEVEFNPELDDFFGVKNVKRGIEPQNELRDEIRETLKTPVRSARQERTKIWDEAAGPESARRVVKDTPEDSVENAVKNADRKMLNSRAEPSESEEDPEEVLRELASDVVGDNEEAQVEYIQEIREKGLPFVIEPVGWRGQDFIELNFVKEDGERRVIITINTRHRFYKEMYAPLFEMAGKDPSEITEHEAKRTASRAAEALLLMITAYAKAESMHEHPHDQYGNLRMHWGQFLHTLMRDVRSVL